MATTFSRTYTIRFLFGFLKNSVYSHHLHTVEQLQEGTINKVGSFTQKSLQNVFNNIQIKINMCL